MNPTGPLRFRLLLGLSASLLALARSASADESEEDSAVDPFAEQDLGGLLDQVVSSTGDAQSSREAPSVISSVSGESLRRSGARSVAEALEFLPGLTFFDDHRLPNLTIRGVHGGVRGWGRYIKFMIDGHTLAYQATNHNWMGLAAIPLDIVDRIEVIRGPASTLYGANAFLGVVNIVTKRPEELPTARAGVTGGLVESNPAAGGAVTVSHDGHTWHGVVAGEAIREDRSGLVIQTYPGLQLEDELRGEPTRNDVRFPKSGYFRLGRLDDDIGDFTVSAVLQHHDTFAEFQDYTLLAHDNHVSMLNGFARLEWDHEIEPADLRLHAETSYSFGDTLPNEELNLNGQSFVPSHYRGDTAFRREMDYGSVNGRVEATYSFLDADSVKVGLDVYRIEATDPSRTEFLTVDRGRQSAGTVLVQGTGERHASLNLGTYAQAVVHVIRDLSLTGGARYDHNDVYGDDVSLRGGAVYSMWSQLSVKALVGTSIMAPAHDQLYSERIVDTGDVIGNDQLVTQKARTAELALDWEPARIFRARVNVFDTQLDDKIEFAAVGGDFLPENVASGRTRGIESEVGASVGRFDFDTTFAYASSDSADSASNQLPNAPQWTAAASVNTELPEAFLNLYVVGRYRSSINAANGPTVGDGIHVLPSVFVMDANVSTLGLDLFGRDAAWSDDGRAFLRVTNIFDNQYSDPGYRGVDVPALGRSYFLGVEYTWH